MGKRGRKRGSDLKFGVTVEEEGGVVGVCAAGLVQGLEVLGEVADALGVEKAANHVRGLHVLNRLDVLGHRAVKVALGVQMVAVHLVNLHHEARVTLLREKAAERPVRGGICTRVKARRKRGGDGHTWEFARAMATG